MRKRHPRVMMLERGTHMPDIGHQLQPAAVHVAHDVPPNDAQFWERTGGSNSVASNRSCKGKDGHQEVDDISKNHAERNGQSKRMTEAAAGAVAWA
jgi:hypothetical protein